MVFLSTTKKKVCNGTSLLIMLSPLRATLKRVADSWTGWTSLPVVGKVLALERYRLVARRQIDNQAIKLLRQIHVHRSAHANAKPGLPSYSLRARNETRKMRRQC